jgi:hypothetical protein
MFRTGLSGAGRRMAATLAAHLIQALFHGQASVLGAKFLWKLRVVFSMPCSPWQVLDIGVMFPAWPPLQRWVCFVRPEPRTSWPSTTAVPVLARSLVQVTAPLWLATPFSFGAGYLLQLVVRSFCAREWANCVAKPSTRWCCVAWHLWLQRNDSLSSALQLPGCSGRQSLGGAIRLVSRPACGRVNVARRIESSVLCVSASAGLCRHSSLS